MRFSRLRLSRKNNPKGYVFAPFLLQFSRFRMHLAAIFLGFITLVSTVLWCTGSLQKSFDKAICDLSFSMGKMGYRFHDVLIQGRHFTSKHSILHAIHMHQGQSIFTHSPEDVKARLEQLPWVKKAIVHRQLPGILHIFIQEHKPIARWQHQQKFALVAEDGAILNVPISPDFHTLPIVVGLDAPQQTPSLLNLLSSYPEVQKRLSAIVRVNKRRWDLMLQRGVTIKLPETGVESALARLNFILEGKKVNLDEVDAIDLRLPKQMIAKVPMHTAARLKLKGVAA